jgi:hypothetical protein
LNSAICHIARDTSLKIILAFQAWRYWGKKWRREVAYAVTQLRKSFIADYVVLGGGLVHRFSRLPEGTERGQNENAFPGGMRLWETNKRTGRKKWCVL